VVEATPEPVPSLGVSVTGALCQLESALLVVVGAVESFVKVRVDAASVVPAT
jgi:hypothetical protein